MADSLRSLFLCLTRCLCGRRIRLCVHESFALILREIECIRKNVHQNITSRERITRALDSFRNIFRCDSRVVTPFFLSSLRSLCILVCSWTLVLLYSISRCHCNRRMLECWPNASMCVWNEEWMHRSFVQFRSAKRKWNRKKLSALTFRVLFSLHFFIFLHVLVNSKRNFSVFSGDRRIWFGRMNYDGTEKCFIADPKVSNSKKKTKSNWKTREKRSEEKKKSRKHFWFLLSMVDASNGRKISKSNVVDSEFYL